MYQGVVYKRHGLHYAAVLTEKEIFVAIGFEASVKFDGQEELSVYQEIKCRELSCIGSIRLTAAPVFETQAELRAALLFIIGRASHYAATGTAVAYVLGYEVMTAHLRIGIDEEQIRIARAGGQMIAYGSTPHVLFEAQKAAAVNVRYGVKGGGIGGRSVVGNDYLKGKSARKSLRMEVTHKP